MQAAAAIKAHCRHKGGRGEEWWTITLLSALPFSATPIQDATADTDNAENVGLVV